MKNIYLLIIAFVLIVGAGYFFQLRSNSDKAPYKISANVAAEMMKESANVIVVDVRTPEEYQQGHIENAKLIDKNFLFVSWSIFSRLLYVKKIWTTRYRRWMI